MQKAYRQKCEGGRPAWLRFAKQVFRGRVHCCLGEHKNNPERIVTFPSADHSILVEGRTLRQAEIQNYASLTDEEIVQRVLGGEVVLFELLMRRHNQRLYRAARAILRDYEAEDVMQEAYVLAYQHLGQFAGRARFSTWLTRIAVNEALTRRKAKQRLEHEPRQDDEGAERKEDFLEMIPDEAATMNPEYNASRSQMRELLEAAIETLPDSLRAVFILREVEEMSTDEVAESLGLTEENVKVRLHRARRALRDHLYEVLGRSAPAAFQFEAVRCDRVVNEVLKRLESLPAASWHNGL